MPDIRIKQSDICYFAGFFDGEGSVGIYPGKYVVSLTNIDIRPLKQAYEFWGGHITVQKARGRKFATHDLWRWQIYGHSARIFLQDIRPFVVVKLEQIDVYLDTLKFVPAVGGKYKPGDDEMIKSGLAKLSLLKKAG